MKSYITVILISALLLSTLFFALPKTENLFFFDDARFDLNKKDDAYWKQELILEIGIDPKDKFSTTKKVDEAKNIIYKRLNKIGVEEIQITNHEIREGELEEFVRLETDENYIREYIKVTVQTTKNESFVQRLISSIGDIKIMLPKEDLDDLSEEDQFELYSPGNYEDTKWDRDAFRNILVKDLRTPQAENTYFAIFKTKFGSGREFRNFLEEYKGEKVGVFVDGFVIPVEVQEEDIQLFAISIGPDKEEAQFQNILLNTGVIPAEELLVISTTELEPQIYKVDHIQVSLALLVSILSLLYFLYQREKENKEKIQRLAFSLLLLFSISLTILKIFQAPVDLFLLIPTGLLATIYIKTMYTCPNENRIILIIVLIISALMLTLGTGYIPTLGMSLLFIILISFVTEILTNLYFENIKIINR